MSLEILVQQYVRRLDVSVDDARTAIVMQIGKSLGCSKSYLKATVPVELFLFGRSG